MPDLILGIFVGLACCYGFCFRRTRRQLNALETELDEIRKQAPTLEGYLDFFSSTRQLAEISNGSYLEVLLRRAQKIKLALNAKTITKAH